MNIYFMKKVIFHIRENDQKPQKRVFLHVYETAYRKIIWYRTCSKSTKIMNFYFFRSRWFNNIYLVILQNIAVIYTTKIITCTTMKIQNDNSVISRILFNKRKLAINREGLDMISINQQRQY